VAIRLLHAVGRCFGTTAELINEMAQLIFLNERSHPTGDLHPAVAGQLLSDLTDVLLRIKGILPQVSLISAEPLPTMQVGNAYSVAIWLNENGLARERARFLLSLGQQAPFRVVRDMHGDPDPGATIYRYAGEVVEGIGLADLYGGVPVSFRQEMRWRVPMLLLDVDQLIEDGERSWSAEIRHVSLIEHIELHRIWLISLRRRNFENVTDLCVNRAEFFPHLEFGPRIEADLRSLEPPALQRVVHYLHRLNDSVEEWDPADRPMPAYPPNTSDESEARKPLCHFPAPGGELAAYTWHGRYTPGPGRIHFRVERNPARVILGYIGRKIGA
jgi:hypothetical protein